MEKIKSSFNYIKFRIGFSRASTWQSGRMMRMGDYANLGAHQKNSVLPSMPLPPPNWSSVQVQPEGRGLHQQPTVDGGPCFLHWVCQLKGEVQNEIVGRLYRDVSFHQSEMFPFRRWWRCFIDFNAGGNVIWWNYYCFALDLLFPETQSIVVNSECLSFSRALRLRTAPTLQHWQKKVSSAWEKLGQIDNPLWLESRLGAGPKVYNHGHENWLTTLRRVTTTQNDTLISHQKSKTQIAKPFWVDYLHHATHFDQNPESSLPLHSPGAAWHGHDHLEQHDEGPWPGW